MATRKREKAVQLGLAKPWGQVTRLKGVGLGRDKDGFFVYTHRARSKSYARVEAIPDKVVKFIDSTG